MEKYARFRYQPCLPLGKDGRRVTASAEHISLSAKAATEKMGQIAVMLDGNVAHVHNIRETVSQVSSVVDNNSATSEETAAVSEEQKVMVGTMVSLMDKFVI